MEPCVPPTDGERSRGEKSIEPADEPVSSSGKAALDVVLDRIEGRTVTALKDEVAPQKIDPKKVDLLLAREMAGLQTSEREEVYHDLHGIGDAGAVETPGMVEKGLAKLDEELKLLTVEEKSAYEQARSMDCSYVENRKFRLAFLRADRFDATKAALRIVKHFQYKLELFGLSKLAKNIVQDDLEKGDMEAIYSGTTQILPFRDRAGRLVRVWFSDQKQKQSSISEIAKVSLDGSHCCMDFGVNFLTCILSKSYVVRSIVL